MQPAERLYKVGKGFIIVEDLIIMVSEPIL